MLDLRSKLEGRYVVVTTLASGHFHTEPCTWHLSSRRRLCLSCCYFSAQVPTVAHSFLPRIQTFRVLPVYLLICCPDPPFQASSELCSSQCGLLHHHPAEPPTHMLFLYKYGFQTQCSPRRRCPSLPFSWGRSGPASVTCTGTNASCVNPLIASDSFVWSYRWYRSKS